MYIHTHTKLCSAHVTSPPSSFFHLVTLGQKLAKVSDNHQVIVRVQGCTDGVTQL